MHSAQTGPARLFKSLPRRISRVLWAYASSAASVGVQRIRFAVPGADPNWASARVAIYVSFDRHGLIADYVVNQVAALAACGRRVTFISHSPRLPADGEARLAPHVREIVHRRNYGHDFGAFKDGIGRLGNLADVHSLILMNDSCYGPFGRLADVEASAEASGRDIFGITESWAHRYHLQTYYLWIAGRVLISPAFASFWQSLLTRQSRGMVIFRGEIRFTQDMLKAGFSAGALCPYTELAQLAYAAARHRLQHTESLLPEERRHFERLAGNILAGVPLNPTHFFWDILAARCRSPFIKRELLRKNPAFIPGLFAWEGALDKDADIRARDAARQHLKLG